MIAALGSFVHELRAAGVPVSMVEALDAARAVVGLGVADRSAFRSALATTLVKHARHQPVFDTVFDVFFGGGAGPVQEVPPSAAAAGAGGDDHLIEVLVEVLAAGDEESLRGMVRRVVELLAGFEPGRPAGGSYYRHRVLRGIGLDEVLAGVVAALGSDGETPLEARIAAEEARDRVDAFVALVDAEIRRRLVADRGPEAVARALRHRPVEDLDLTAAARDELAQMERVIRPLARRLAVRLSRNRRHGRRGRLDVRTTIRRSLSYGGVPVDPRFRPPHPGRPEIALLCDLSGSVSAFARFTMQLVHAVSGQFSRVRSFGFVDAVDELTDHFAPGADIGDVLSVIGSEARVVWFDGHSDYGRVFAQFAATYLESLSPRTTLIITGDARTNYHDPDVGSLRAIAGELRAVYWLNPERRLHWDTGDSVIGVYREACDGVYEVRTLRQLEAFVERVALPARLKTASSGADDGHKRM
jgi:uncharacterized protein with von Willebrand factor type A (vWA) domain